MARDDDVAHGEIDWTTAFVREGRLTVDVAGEPDLRQLLESAVLQANAEFAPDDDEDGDDEGGSERDRAMTAAFRAFAEAGDREDDPGDAGAGTRAGDAAAFGDAAAP
jgi:hypothetical protein